MTQIVGIVCKDTIVIASESQYTIGQGWKQLEQQKMDKFCFKDNNGILVALAGAVKPAMRVIEKMKEMAKDKTSEDIMAGANLAINAIKQYRNEVLDFYQQPHDLAAAEQDKIFSSEDRCFEIIIGHAYGNKRHERIPCLCRINVYDGLPEMIKDYVVIGSGSQLATFMLNQFQYKGMEFGEALSLAIDSIERVKGSDLFCGGQVRVGLLHSKIFEEARVGFFPSDHIDRVIQKLNKLRSESAEWYKDKFTNVTKEIHNENFELEKARLKAEQEYEN